MSAPPLPNAEPDFLKPEERRLNEEFLSKGFVVVPAEQPDMLARIRDHVVSIATEELGLAIPGDPGEFLNAIHGRIAEDQLNRIRLSIIAGINDASWFRPAYFNVARSVLEMLVGNEIAMQRRINLSIQLPDDDSSLLPIHSDVWAGDSPYEVVVWIPLVDCYATKTMFLLPPDKNAKLVARMHEFQAQSSDMLQREFEQDLVWLTVPYGSVLVFNQCLAHGNVVNRTSESRWSMNCRFKGVFTPYADKKLGEFFEPVTLRAASRVGLAYQLPRGFDG